MPINALIPMSVRDVELGRSVNSGAIAGNNLMVARDYNQAAPLRAEARQAEVDLAKTQAASEREEQRMKSLAMGAVDVAARWDRNNPKAALDYIQARKSILPNTGNGYDTKDTEELEAAILSGDMDAAEQMIRNGVQVAQMKGYLQQPADPRTTKQRNLESAGIMPGSPEYSQAMMGGGNSSMGDVRGQKGGTDIVMIGDAPYTLGTVFDPLSQKWSNQLVPVTDPTGGGGQIEFPGSSGVVPSQRPGQKQNEAQATKAGEMATARSEKYIDQLDGIRLGISNIDDAIAALDDGAETGVVYNMFPTMREATLKLENVGRRMGLDVIGAVTFGALSEGEREMAMATALPRGLKPPALRQWLVDRKIAQTKLADYYQEAAIYLSKPGNTSATWLEQGGGSGRQGGQIMEDAQGNRAMVYPDGTVEELQ
jgi:hypothetical protein